MILGKSILTATLVSALALGTAPAMAQTAGDRQNQSTQSQSPTQRTPGQTGQTGQAGQTQSGAQQLRTAQDNSFVGVTGTVRSMSDDSFQLNYGGKQPVTVMMDDLNWEDANERLSEGERVTVYGRVNNDLYDKRTIEASSVYAHDRSTYYYINDASEESQMGYNYQLGIPVLIITTDAAQQPMQQNMQRNKQGQQGQSQAERMNQVAPAARGQTQSQASLTMTGTVEDTQGQQFTLNTGQHKIKVNTAQLGYDPFEAGGNRSIETGDRVWVSGPLGDNFFDQKEIQAQAVVTLSEGQRSGETVTPTPRSEQR